MTKKKQKSKSRHYSTQLIQVIPFIAGIVVIGLIAVIFTFIFSVKLPIQSTQQAFETTLYGAIPTNIQFSPTPIPKPELVPYASYPPELTAQAALAMDEKSGWVLYAKNIDTPLWPASTTKLMTALVALNTFHLDEVITITNPIPDGSKMDLVEGEQIRLENLLYGLLIQSANDAAFAIADYYPEGRERFVEKMNEKAIELSLSNTHFTDPAGFDNTKQYTTAQDLANLTRAALSDSVIRKMVAIPEITVSDENYIIFHKLKNVNQLLGKVPGVAGVKTGWTENAKENLINLTKRNGKEVLTVVLGSSDRFGETEKLTNWVFNNYLFP